MLMFVFKLIISSIIIGITSYLGFLKSKKLYDREYILREYVTFLKSVKNEIEYCLNILPNAYEISRQKLNTKLKFVIGNIVNDMIEGNDIDKSIVDNVNNISELNNYDKDTIITSLKSLGKSNVEGQINIILNSINNIESLIIEANEYKQKNSKMYKNIGTISGLVIVVLLI
jgi:stage III sporulation protein AB